MKRRVFYSFHYQADCWRTAQVRNIGAIEGSPVASHNDWEQIKRGGDSAIKRWINDQLNGCSCTVVLIGAETADRPWVRYEIERSWNEGKGVLGVYIHSLLDQNRRPSQQGRNPFDAFTMNGSDRRLSSLVTAHNPVGYSSQDVYSVIANSLAGWVEDAIKARNG